MEYHTDQTVRAPQTGTREPSENTQNARYPGGVSHKGMLTFNWEIIRCTLKLSQLRRTPRHSASYTGNHKYEAGVSAPEPGASCARLNTPPRTEHCEKAPLADSHAQPEQQNGTSGKGLLSISETMLFIGLVVKRDVTKLLRLPHKGVGESHRRA